MRLTKKNILLLTFILMQALPCSTFAAGKLIVNAHNQFISYLNTRSGTSSDPLVILNSKWGNIEIQDINDPTSEINTIDDIIASAKLETPFFSEPPLFYPSPFKVSDDPVLGYRFNRSDLDIEFFLYDIRGDQVLKHIFVSGQIGARVGYNKVHLSTFLQDKALPAGVYFYVLRTEGITLGKGKFAVIP